MKELVEWLIYIERLARDFYRSSAQAFIHDAKLAEFLKHMAEEETWHERVMGSIAEHIEKDGNIVAAIALDRTTRERIEAPFSDCGIRLKSRRLTTEHLVHCIVAAEYSEWNAIFMYVVNTLGEQGRDFAYQVSQMQSHRHYIETFLASLPEGGTYLNTIRRLPPAWQTRILIVEDHPGVLEFMRDVLSANASVDTAANGKEGLEKVMSNFYDVVITDFDMPGRDAVEFFKGAAAFDPRLKKRFLFLTGLGDEALEFLDKSRVCYLTKPMRISDIKKMVTGIRDMYASKARAS